MAPSPADTISLPDTLALLDGQFAELASGVADGKYAIWLGSGVSFKKMPRLAELAEIVLEHLRANAALAGPCVYRDSLDRILALTPLDDNEKSNIDISQPVSTWTKREYICRSLVLNYTRMLDLPPRGKSPDYLLWDAVKVVRRYAEARRPTARLRRYPPPKQWQLQARCLCFLLAERAVPQEVPHQLTRRNRASVRSIPNHSRKSSIRTSARGSRVIAFQFLLC